jgi:cholesterol transport system auxiliary component
MKDQRQLCLVALLALASALCGCGTNPVWKVQTFAFSTPTDPPTSTSRTNVVALSRIEISPLFQARSFTYMTADDTYERDPYAAFVVPPDRALEGPIRVWMRNGGAFGRVMEPGSGLVPSVVVEVSVNELYGDLRKPDKPVGTMTIHFVVYELNADGPRRVLLDKIYTDQTPMARRTPAALMVAWDASLRKIMEEISSDYVKAHINDR